MWVADSAYQADFIVFVGDTPKDVMTTYADLTGYSPMMPKWAAGFWQCKCRYESQDILLNVAREYKRRGIPIDAIVIDFFHWTEQGDLKFDPKYCPTRKPCATSSRKWISSLLYPSGRQSAQRAKTGVK